MAGKRGRIFASLFKRSWGVGFISFLIPPKQPSHPASARYMYTALNVGYAPPSPYILPLVPISSSSSIDEAFPMPESLMIMLGKEEVGWIGKKQRWWINRTEVTRSGWEPREVLIMLVENAGPSDKELAIIGQGVILSTAWTYITW